MHFSDGGHKHGKHVRDKPNDGDKTNNDQPKPQKYVNLFVNDVDGQNANRVMGLNGT